MSDPRWQPWTMDPLERRAPNRKSDSPGRRKDDHIRAEMLDKARAEARKHGFAQGHAEGLERGYAEAEAKVRGEHEQAMAAALAERVARLDDMVQSFVRARDGLSDMVAARLTDLGLEVGRQLAGEALRAEPAHIVVEVEALLAEHPGLEGNPTLYLNVDDLAIVEQELSASLDGAGWRLRGDINLARGDCRIETAAIEIDGTEQDRWQRLLHAVGRGSDSVQ